MKNTNNKSAKLRSLVAVSLFCALAYICVFLIKFKVSFLTFDLKDAVMAIGAMYFGPISAIVMSAIVSFIEFLTISDTGVYGLIMNFLSSAVFCLIASIIYKFKKDLAGAVIGLVSAAIGMTAVMLVANLLVTPYYMGVTAGEVKKMIPTLLFPFNLMKGVVNASVVMLLYKHFSLALKSSGIVHSVDEGDVSSSPVKPGKAKQIAVVVGSAAVLALALVVLFIYLKADIA